MNSKPGNNSSVMIADLISLGYFIALNNIENFKSDQSPKGMKNGRYLIGEIIRFLI